MAAIGSRRFFAVDHEDRPDEIVDGERGFAHQPPRPVGAAVAAQASAAGDSVDVGADGVERSGHRSVRGCQADLAFGAAALQPSDCGAALTLVAGRSYGSHPTCVILRITVAENERRARRTADQQGARLPLTVIYMRVVAMLLLVAGLARACQVLGIMRRRARHSTILTPAMRSGAVTLLMVDLLAAVGLWIGAAWGPVMWAVALAVEVSMYTIFSDLFGSYPLRVLVHACIFIGLPGAQLHGVAQRPSTELEVAKSSGEVDRFDRGNI